jgi:hypothetical protein
MCPGADGLPYEFYCHFKNELLPLMLRVFNAAFQADLQGLDDVAPLQDQGYSWT